MLEFNGVLKGVEHRALATRLNTGQEALLEELQRLIAVAWLDEGRAQELRSGADQASGLAQLLDHLETDYELIVLLAGRASAGRAPVPPVNSRGPEAEPRPQPMPSDSLDRLDALARLLDQRLKQAQEVTTASTGPNY